MRIGTMPHAPSGYAIRNTSFHASRITGDPMPATNIVIIGAGSASFGASTLATIIRSQPLKGSQIGLVDLNAEGLQHTACTAERMNQAWDAHMTIRASTDRRELLPGAN